MRTCIFGLIFSASLGAFAAGEYDVSLADYPRLAGEADDGARIQRAVDATGHGSVLYLPKGTYESSRTIWVTNGTSLLLHKSATVRATARMECLFHVDMTHSGCWAWGGKLRDGLSYDQGLFFRGGHLDGNGFATCLFVNHYFHLTLRDVVFANGFPYGLHVGRNGAEVIADNLYFRTLKSGLAGNVALFTEGNDSYYSHVVAVDYTIGLRTSGGANAFSHCHVWGGPVPPSAPGRLPEMLENSICFDLGGYMNQLRDCYADTGAIGFRVAGWGQQILGCWFLNNAHFKLKDVVVVKQLAGSRDLLVADCVFYACGVDSKVYEGLGAVKWRDMIYNGFPKGAELPAEIVTGRDCACKDVDEWEYVGELLKFESAPGEFMKENSARSVDLGIPGKLVHARFPKAGPGNAVVIRVRATDETTKQIEFSVSQADGRRWGKLIAIGSEWQDIRIPFAELRCFNHNGGKAELQPGETPDARLMTIAHFMFGKWISGGTADRAHGFEVSSFKIVGR